MQSSLNVDFGNIQPVGRYTYSFVPTIDGVKVFQIDKVTNKSTEITNSIKKQK